ncbi:MAG: ATP-dependent 6-phosphofructokinase [Candidatus Tritonobacter lacicola]|nr:ATP-dependent 6-phosphofructokinase [Candidatus Tritonobacter lacicola]
MKRIGVLTGGGDCPGLNAVLVGIVRKSIKEGYEVIGIKHGWKGMIEKETVPLDLKAVTGCIHRGGTIIRTSRTNPLKSKDDIKKVAENYRALKLDALIAIGGDDTLGVAAGMYKEGLNTVGVPKTIDNDISGTDRTFGFDTAVNFATWALDRLHTTAESHERVIVVEIMGRHAGWLALWAGMAGGADVILIPEVQVGLEEICSILKERHEKRGRTFSIVAVAEGASFGEDITQDDSQDEFGHVKLGGVAEFLAKEIQERTGYETRHVVLGHLQRGGEPSALDRYLGLLFGLHAVELVKNEDFGKMVSLRGNDFVAVTLEEVTAGTRTVPPELYEQAKVFFG